LKNLLHWTRVLLQGNRKLVASIAALLLCFPVISYYKFDITKGFFDALEAKGVMQTAIILAVLLFLLQLMEGQLGKLQQYLNERLSLKVSAALDTFLLNRIKPATITKLESPQYRHDLNLVRTSLSSLSMILTSLINLIHQSVLIAMYGYLILAYDIWTVLITVVFSLPSIYYAVGRLKREDRYNRNATQEILKSNNLAGLMAHPYVVKELIVFAAQPMLFARWLAATKENISRRVAFLGREYRLSLLFMSFSPAGFLFIQVILLQRLMRSEISLGEYVAITGTATMLDSALKQFWASTDVMKKIQLFTNHYSHFEREYMDDRHGAGAIRLEQLKETTARGVRFRYAGQQRWVLHSVDIDIRCGESIAFVGENGSGKSTLAKVLFGFHDIPRGQILFNQIDVNDYKREDLYEHIAIVNQDFNKYPLSVYENIAMKECTEQEKSRVDHFLRQYPSLVPQHLDRDTVLGNEYIDSAQLSGGQWQRIAIARALYKNAPVLILDEATSELDPETEISIIDRVLAERRDRMTLIITHNLNLSSRVNRIYVLHEGCVVEHGSHEQLMALRGKYYAMWISQLKGEERHVGERAMGNIR